MWDRNFIASVHIQTGNNKIGEGFGEINFSDSSDTSISIIPLRENITEADNLFLDIKVCQDNCITENLGNSTKSIRI